MKSTIEQQGLTEEEFYQNISEGIPSCEKILGEIPKFISALQDAFDDSHSKCRGFLSENGKIQKANKQFYPPMMRFLVHNYLEQEGVKNKLVDQHDAPVNENETKQMKNWEPDVLASNGIAGIFSGYNYRVLKAIKYKATNGELQEVKEIKDLLPPPGSYDPENPKCKFYCQVHLKAYQQYFMAPEKYDKPSLKPNIVVVWDVDEHSFIKLYLAVPLWGNGRQVTVFDMVAIKHPAEIIVSEKQPEINHAFIGATKDSVEQNNDKIENSIRK